MPSPGSLLKNQCIPRKSTQSKIVSLNISNTPFRMSFETLHSIIKENF